jgi:hypothetical protein
MALPFVIAVWLTVQSAWRARAGEHGVLPLALLCSLFLSNMSGDWVASKLLWLVLAYALASGKWRSSVRWRLPVRSRRWMMTLPSSVRS